MRRWALALALAALASGMAGAAVAADTRPARPAATARRPLVAQSLEPFGPGYDEPYHGTPGTIAYGGEAELRFATDRVLGVGNPDWASVQRVSGFARARIRPGVQLAGGVAYDKATDDLVVERALIVMRVRKTLDAQAGILPLPLLRANLEPGAWRSEFIDRSLVATELVGVPNSQIGAGVRGIRPSARGPGLTYELDLVTGFSDGLLLDSPNGTRLPRGRNNFGDNNGTPSVVARVAAHPAAGAEIGLAAMGGAYNRKDLGGVTVDHSRGVYLAVADGAALLAGFRLSGEAALAYVDVPPGLVGLFAERQWGGSLQAARTLREPIVGGWTGSSLAAALRVDAVDFDRAIPGDSKSRVTATLNLRPRITGVIRFGWYYEIRRDRFNNDVPAAGLTLGIASCL